MDRESPELIKQDMNETRQALTDKVAALEQQVVGTIQDATSAVHETVSTVKTAFKDSVGAVTESVSSVSQGVKEAFDIRSHIRANPWPIIAGAALSGFMTGYVSKSGRHGARSFARSTDQMNRAWSESSLSTPAPSGGILDDLTQRVQQELRNFAESALTVLAASLKQTMNSGIQNLVGSAIASASAKGNEASPLGERNGFANGRAQNVH